VTETEMIDQTSRAANIGISLALKKFHPDEVKVYELSLEDILGLSKELKDLLIVFQEQSSTLSDEDGLGALAILLGNPIMLHALKQVAAGSTRKTPDDFSDMGASDWLKWAIAFKTVNDWEELRQLFFQLIPKGAMDSLLTPVEASSSKSSTDLEASTDGLPKRS
tara:strand:+ start:518 stop:1012 length:495 start_codon:yes stop_codon:yes gene_type:complete